MKREQIDAVLNETIQGLLDKGADRETLELACAGAMFNLKVDSFRTEPHFKGTGSKALR
jgi:hypothetical protein